jgi:large subunit ribosomal protein L32
MGLPSKRRTKQQKRERSSHFALVSKGLTTCEHCKRKILPHRVCPNCGYYRGRQVLKLETSLEKKAKKQKKVEPKKDEQPSEKKDA